MNSFKQYLNKLVTERYTVLWAKDGQEGDYNQASVDDAHFLKALNYLKTDTSVLDDAKQLLLQSGFNEASVRGILHLVYDYENPENFAAALKNKMPMSTFLQCGNVINYVSETYKLDLNLTRDLLLYQAPTVPVTGKAEAFIMLFVEGASKGSRKIDKSLSKEERKKAHVGGDIIIGTEKYEIKGSGARIRANKTGYGTPERAVSIFEKNLRQLIKYAGLKETFTADDLSITVNDYGFADRIMPALIATGKVQHQQVVQLYYSWISELYINDALLTELNLKGWLSQSIDQKTGQIIKSVFEKKYFEFALKYYAKVDQFTSIVLISTKAKDIGKIAFTTQADILADKISPTVTYDGLPTLSKKAAQAAFFRIKIAGTASTPEQVTDTQ